MTELPNLSRIEGFDWDRANIQKNWEAHRVAFYECEEVFFRDPILVPDFGHSATEARYFAFGRTGAGRLLAVVFTMRASRIRIVSARDMNRKERKRHGKIQKNS